ncbi:MAG: hypothetical protein NTV40_05065 [Solirubrobacterales bacterium]|nr:hypothetical protein [Solirubrobacterales bacterium]
MAKLLVVANETLGGRSLIEKTKERSIALNNPEVLVIAPQNRPRAGSVIYDETVRDAAQHRVDATIAELRQEGVHATGEIMDPDPFAAIMDAVGDFHPDEIVVSTHPETRSGWLRRDLVGRVAGEAGVPVHHVVVDLDADRIETTHTLVIANQTVASAPLLGLLQGKAKEKHRRFTVIVPLDGGHGHHAQATRKRLAETLDQMTEGGLEATGAIGDPDPFTAIMNAMQFYRVDEIVISTLPATRSGWQRSDLVERVKRSTAVPVEHVVSDTEAQEESST